MDKAAEIIDDINLDNQDILRLLDGVVSPILQPIVDMIGYEVADAVEAAGIEEDNCLF